MNDTVKPIRPDIVPDIDIVREMTDYFRTQLADHIAKFGEPASICIALVAPNNADGISTCHSWNPRDENTSRIQSCATASALFLNHALGR